MQIQPVPVTTTPAATTSPSPTTQHITRFGSVINRAPSTAAANPRRVWFRLVTRDVDRHGTIIEPAGVRLEAFRQNPVFLWMHSSGGEGAPTPSPDVVIGAVAEIDQTVDHLDIGVDFDDDSAATTGNEHDGLAEVCLRKVQRGLLRMVSIGCNTLRAPVMRIVDGVEVPVFTDTELLEASLVIIGSNRNALKLDRAAALALLQRDGSGDGSGDNDLPEPPPEPKKPSQRSAPAAPAAATPAIKRPKQPDHVATVAAFDADNKMLWGRRNDTRKWTTPGGHLEPGEDPAAGARRELFEEAGLRPASLTYLGVVDVRKGVGKPLHVHAFRATVEGSAPRAHSDGDPDGEIAEWRWVALEDGRLPAEIGDNLHAPRNAMHALGVIKRSVGGADGDAAAVLSGVVDTGAAEQKPSPPSQQRSPEQRAPEFVVGSDTDLDALADTFLGGEDGGLVVKSATRSVVVTRTVVPHKAYPTIDKPWDADAAVMRWRKYSSSDGSGDKSTVDWDKYAQCFAWYDGDDKENFTSYRLPHHDIVDGKPVTVWKGVVAAAAAIMGARGGVKIPAADIAKIKAHLGAHYREFDKTPPWVDERALSDAKRAALPSATPTPATTYLPVPIVPPTPTPGHAETVNVPVAADGTPYLCATTTPHALIFPAKHYDATSACRWAELHGYVGTPAIPVGDGATTDGVVVTENSLFVEQLSADLFQQGGFGAVRFSTILLGDGVWCVVGVLKPARLIIEQGRSVAPSVAVATAPAAARLWPELVPSPSARAELRLAVASKSPDAAAAERVLSSGTWAAAGTRFASPHISAHTSRAVAAHSVARAIAAVRNADRAATVEQQSNIQAMLRYTHNVPHYLESKAAQRAATTNRTATSEISHMKRSPAEVRARYQGAIHSSMACAAEHAGMLEDGFVADEHRAFHQAAAMRALDHAEEMHRMCRSVFIGDKPSQDLVMDGAIGSGEVFNLGREISDTDLKQRFAAVSTLVGKLPRQLRSVVKAELGTDDVEIVEEKLLSLKSDRDNFAAVKRSAADNAAKLEQVELQRMIDDAAAKNLVTPAEIKRFRGIDAATDKTVGAPWSKARVERYIADRSESGPVAPIVRPGMERNAAPIAPEAPAAAALPPSKPSVIRTNGMSAPMSQQDINRVAQEAAARLGLDVSKVLARTEAAANIPSSDVSRYVPRQ